MKSLRSRINWSFLTLIGCSVMGTGLYLAWLLTSSYSQSLQRTVIQECEMLAGAVAWEEYYREPAQFQKQVNTIEDKLGVVITFFDRTGKTIGYSDFLRRIQVPDMRADVQQIVRQRKSIVTHTQDEYFHVLVPIIRNNHVVGAIRLSQSLLDIRHALYPVWLSLIGGLVIAYIIAAVASSRIAKGVSRPLEEITQVATDIANQKTHRRIRSIPITEKDEIGRLGNAINQMAQSLEVQMETIRKSERRLSSVIERMESGLLMVDVDGTVSVANRSFERFFGIPAADLNAMPFDQLTYPYDLSEMITECAETGTRIRREIHLYYPEERILEVNLAPMWVQANGVGVVAVFHDLTATRHLEQLRKDLVTNVSHELKTPITSIRGFTETLLEGAMEDRQTAEEFLRIIHRESLRLQRLVTDILDLSQIENKHFQLQIQEIDLMELIESVVQTMEEAIRSKQQTLQIEMTSIRVHVDPDRFKQVVLNLLSNANIYTPVGGWIKLWVGVENGNWMLRISDNGPGIPEADLPRIFERFYRVDKARSRGSGGTGLGLAIVKHLVEEHRGEIQVHSTVGEGTQFHLTFPRNLEGEAIKVLQEIRV